MEQAVVTMAADDPMIITRRAVVALLQVMIITPRAEIVAMATVEVEEGGIIPAPLLQAPAVAIPHPKPLVDICLLGPLRGVRMVGRHLANTQTPPRQHLVAMEDLLIITAVVVLVQYPVARRYQNQPVMTVTDHHQLVVHRVLAVAVLTAVVQLIVSVIVARMVLLQMQVEVVTITRLPMVEEGPVVHMQALRLEQAALELIRPAVVPPRADTPLEVPRLPRLPVIFQPLLEQAMVLVVELVLEDPVQPVQRHVGGHRTVTKHSLKYIFAHNIAEIEKESHIVCERH